MVGTAQPVRLVLTSGAVVPVDPANYGGRLTRLPQEGVVRLTSTVTRERLDHFLYLAEINRTNLIHMNAAESYRRLAIELGWGEMQRAASDRINERKKKREKPPEPPPPVIVVEFEKTPKKGYDSERYAIMKLRSFINETCDKKEFVTKRQKFDDFSDHRINDRKPKAEDLNEGQDTSRARLVGKAVEYRWMEVLRLVEEAMGKRQVTVSLHSALEQLVRVARVAGWQKSDLDVLFRRLTAFVRAISRENIMTQPVEVGSFMRDIEALFNSYSTGQTEEEEEEDCLLFGEEVLAGSGADKEIGITRSDENGEDTTPETRSPSEANLPVRRDAMEQRLYEIEKLEYVRNVIETCFRVREARNGKCGEERADDSGFNGTSELKDRELVCLVQIVRPEIGEKLVMTCGSAHPVYTAIVEIPLVKGRSGNTEVCETLRLLWPDERGQCRMSFPHIVYQGLVIDQVIYATIGPKGIKPSLIHHEGSNDCLDTFFREYSPFETQDFSNPMDWWRHMSDFPECLGRPRKITGWKTFPLNDTYEDLFLYIDEDAVAITRRDTVSPVDALERADDSDLYFSQQD